MAAELTKPARAENLDAEFGELEASEIARLAQTHGWQVAAHDFMRSRNQRAYRLAVDEYGAGLRVLLPLTDQSRVLVLKCGWGAVALNLADCVAQVVAMDDRLSRLQFVEARRAEWPAANLEVIHGSLADPLQFATGEFDAVILLDALEQLRVSEKVSWPLNQSAALESVRRVLARGGSLLVGVPNRLGFPIRRVAGQHPRTYWGYRHELLQAGFSSLQFYAPLPSQREPFFILPLDRWRLLNHFIDGLFTAQDYRAKLESRGLGSAYRLGWALWRAARRLKLTGLARYAMPGYLITARN